MTDARQEIIQYHSLFDYLEALHEKGEKTVKESSRFNFIYGLINNLMEQQCLKDLPRNKFFKHTTNRYAPVSVDTKNPKTVLNDLAKLGEANENDKAKQFLSGFLQQSFGEAFGVFQSIKINSEFATPHKLMSQEEGLVFRQFSANDFSILYTCPLYMLIGDKEGVEGTYFINAKTKKLGWVQGILDQKNFEGEKLVLKGKKINVLPLARVTRTAQILIEPDRVVKFNDTLTLEVYNSAVALDESILNIVETDHMVNQDPIFGMIARFDPSFDQDLIKYVLEDPTKIYEKSTQGLSTFDFANQVNNSFAVEFLDHIKNFLTVDLKPAEFKKQCKLVLADKYQLSGKQLDKAVDKLKRLWQKEQVVENKSKGVLFSSASFSSRKQLTDLPTLGSDSEDLTTKDKQKNKFFRTPSN